METALDQTSHPRTTVSLGAQQYLTVLRGLSGRLPRDPSVALDNTPHLESRKSFGFSAASTDNGRIRAMP